MTKIKNLFTKLYNAYGYPIPNKIIIECYKNNINCIFNKKIYTLKELKNDFKNINNKCKGFYENIIKKSIKKLGFYMENKYF